MTSDQFTLLFLAVIGLLNAITILITRKTANEVKSAATITESTHALVNGQSAALLQVTGDKRFAEGQKDQLATTTAAEIAASKS